MAELFSSFITIRTKGFEKAKEQLSELRNLAKSVPKRLTISASVKSTQSIDRAVRSTQKLRDIGREVTENVRQQQAVLRLLDRNIRSNRAEKEREISREIEANIRLREKQIAQAKRLADAERRRQQQLNREINNRLRTISFDVFGRQSFAGRFVRVTAEVRALTRAFRELRSVGGITIRQIANRFNTFAIGGAIASVEALARGLFRVGSTAIRVGLRAVSFGISLIRRAATLALAPVLGLLRALRLTVTFLPLAAPFLIGRTIREALEFEQELIRIRANFRLLGREGEASFRRIRRFAIETARTTQFLPNEVASLLEVLSRSGLSVEQAQSATKPILDLALAFRVPTEQAATAVSILAKTFNLRGDEIRQASSRIVSSVRQGLGTFPQLARAIQEGAGQAARQGQSLNEFLGIITKLGNAGVFATKAATSASRALAILQAPNATQFKNITKALSPLGKTLDDLRDSVGRVSGVQFFEALQEALPNQSDLEQALQVIFGFRARQAGGLFAGAGFAEFLQNIRQIEQDALDNVSRGTGAAIEDSTLGIFRRFQGAVKGNAFLIVSEFEPALRKLGITLLRASSTFSRFISDSPQFKAFISAITDLFERFGDTLKETLPRIASFGAILNASVLAGFVELANDVLPRVSNWLNAIINNLLKIPTPRKLFDLGNLQDVSALLAAITKNMDALITSVTTLIKASVRLLVLDIEKAFRNSEFLSGLIFFVNQFRGAVRERQQSLAKGEDLDENAGPVRTFFRLLTGANAEFGTRNTEAANAAREQLQAEQEREDKRTAAFNDQTAALKESQRILRGIGSDFTDIGDKAAKAVKKSADETAAALEKTAAAASGRTGLFDPASGGGTFRRSVLDPVAFENLQLGSSVIVDLTRQGNNIARTAVTELEKLNRTNAAILAETQEEAQRLEAAQSRAEEIRQQQAEAESSIFWNTP